MIPFSALVPAPAKRLALTLYGYAFFDEFVLLYPVYALLFTDTGLSVAQISSLFVIWSVTAIVLEVPSGALADAVSRRALLSVGPLIGAAGFALWVLVPSYWAFAAGFVLWGVREALQSGATEALVYEELDRLGTAGTYARTMGRAESAGLLAVLAAIATAGPVFAVGGYPAVGAASVLAGLVTAAIGLALPEHRASRRRDAEEPERPRAVVRERPDAPGRERPDAVQRERPDEEPEPGYLATLRAGLAEARTDRRVRAALLLVVAVTAVWSALEEYVPLLAADAGVRQEDVPLLVLLVWIGAAAGGLLAGAGRRMPPRMLGAAVGFAALALAVGAMSARPAGFVLVAAAFGVFQMAGVVADARLQERIGGPSRATVTSLAGLGTETVTVLVYVTYAGVATVARHGVVFALLAVPYLFVALRLLHRGRTRERRAAAPLTDATTAP